MNVISTDDLVCANQMTVPTKIPLIQVKAPVEGPRIDHVGMARTSFLGRHDRKYQSALRRAALKTFWRLAELGKRIPDDEFTIGLIYCEMLDHIEGGVDNPPITAEEFFEALGYKDAEDSALCLPLFIS